LLLAGLLTVTAWKLLTGGLHLDGLADCLDGLGGRDAEHRLAIMRDSRIGAFGALGLILLLLLEIAAVTEMPPGVRTGALLVVPAVARATPALLARLFSPAKQEGLGAAFGAGVGALAAPAALSIALVAAVVALRAGRSAGVGEAGRPVHERSDACPANGRDHRRPSRPRTDAGPGAARDGDGPLGGADRRGDPA